MQSAPLLQGNTMKSVTLTKAAFDVLIHQIKQLTKERDEARFMFCHLAANLYRRSAKRTVQNVADVLGWDCYKIETKKETK